MKQIKILIISLLLLTILVPKPSYAAGDAAAIIPYLVEQISKQAKSIAEMIKQTTKSISGQNSFNPGSIL